MVDKKRFDNGHLSSRSDPALINRFFFIDRNDNLHLSTSAGVWYQFVLRGPFTEKGPLLVCAVRSLDFYVDLIRRDFKDINGAKTFFGNKTGPFCKRETNLIYSSTLLSSNIVKFARL